MKKHQHETMIISLENFVGPLTNIATKNTKSRKNDTSYQCSSITFVAMMPITSSRKCSENMGKLMLYQTIQSDTFPSRLDGLSSWIPCSSYQLDKLAAQLRETQFINLQKSYPQQWTLLSKKGVYPYDYMNTMERFEETSLPDKGAFYSRLDEKCVSLKHYQHANNVWNSFRCTTMKDYHDLYLKTDVLLLADVFETFQKMALETYKLDPVHYYSLPGLSWDSILKYTEIKIDLITDPDMYQMVEKSMRGGISQISHRYAASNYPGMESYDERKPQKILTYQDANALYSWAMSQPLPLKNFKWTDPIDVMSIPDDNSIGYILEVDLEYPKELHDQHNDYPLAPEHLEITDDIMAPFQQEHFPKIRGSVNKLVPNLMDKEYVLRYVLHYRNLKLYLNLGMKITKIHRVIQFDQSLWMKSYIDLNTVKRREAVENGDKVGKDLFKLFNNAVFGKTMENLRKRINFEIVTSRKVALKRIAKPNFKRAKRFREDLVGIHSTKPVLVRNRPIQVGFAVLDLSKYHMYNFHYNVWMKQFPNSKLLFTDTDSLAYEVTDHDLYVGLSAINNEFDFSEYPKNHPLYSIENMKTVGKFKDECFGRLMLRFVGLRPKLHSYEYAKRSLL